MTNTLYKKLLGVSIWHDYYRTGIEGGSSLWPKNYNIHNEWEIEPSPSCRDILRDQRIRFIKTDTGFQLWVQAVPSKISPMDYRTFIQLDNSRILSFFLKLKNPYYINFTNFPLTNNQNVVCFFHNRVVNYYAGHSFLSRPLPVYPNFYPGQELYHLGDMISHNLLLHEAVIPVRSTIDPDLDPAEWEDITSPDARYVNRGDLIQRQGINYTYSRPNIAPGEVIRFVLKDQKENEIDLGLVPHTGQPQNKYHAPAAGGDDVFHRLNLEHLPSGMYTLGVEDSTGLEETEFYFMSPMASSDVFGIIEMHADISSPEYRFVRHMSSPTLPDESVISGREYRIHFKNRTTNWRYRKKDGSATGHEERHPLTLKYSEVSAGSGPLPNPDISIIHPERDGTSENLVSAVYSEIYLNET